jgi:hypothetical protein
MCRYISLIFFKIVKEIKEKGGAGYVEKEI